MNDETQKAPLTAPVDTHGNAPSPEEPANGTGGGHKPASPSVKEKQVPTSRVWSAENVEIPEAEPKGLRIGQALWAAVVFLTGVLCVLLAFFRHIDFPLLLISFIAALGIGLIALAVIVGRSKS